MVEPTIAVIGIGRMGLPIATRLKETGFSVAVTDRKPGLAGRAQGAGLTWVEDLPELASSSEIVVTVLPGPAELRELIGPLLASMRPGSTWIDLTTAVPAVSAEIRTKAAGRIRTLECAVGGNPDAARSGSLLGYVGADPDDLQAHRSLLDALCRELAHVGPPGTGYAVKLLVNALWFGQALAVAETIALGSRLGLDPQALKDTLTRGPAASEVVTEAGGALLSGDDMTSFPLARCLEEIEGVLKMAAGQELSPPITHRVAELYQEALSHYGDVDGELLAARYLSERLGVRFSGDPRADAGR